MICYIKYLMTKQTVDGFDIFAICALYSQKHKRKIVRGVKMNYHTNGLTVCDWLAGQDFNTQYEFGLSALRMFSVIE